MKTYLARSGDGSELGRLLARTDDEAMKTARECWPGRAAKAIEIETQKGSRVEEDEDVDPLS